MRLAGVGHVALVTRDLDRLVAYSGVVWGPPPPPARAHRPLILELGGGVGLHVFEQAEGALGGVADDAALRPLARGRVDHVSLEAADPGAFAAARERLVALGAAEETVVDFGPLASVFFRDPDGRELELSLAKPPGWAPPFALTPFRPRR